jgi:hypothetical protein
MNVTTKLVKNLSETYNSWVQSNDDDSIDDLEIEGDHVFGAPLDSMRGGRHGLLEIDS